MDKSTLEALEEALKSSPNNLVLRKQVARGYFNLKDYEKAKTHCNLLVQQEPSLENKLELARCYGKLKNHSTAIVILEEILDRQIMPEAASLYLQLLIDNGQQADAIDSYQEFQRQLADWRDPAIEKQLKIGMQESSGSDSGESEDNYNPFLEAPELDFSKVGGMEDIKDEIRIKIIQPLQNPDLFKAFGKKAGGGILLYGPPGCGKTYLAKATAGEMNSKFIAIGIDEILDMWMGNSEKNLRAKFELARKNKPCVLFFDEIDALGSKRGDLKQSASRNVINQFLKELDGVDSDNEGVLILGATNSPWHMDSAFLRPGRFDRIIFVPPPDLAAREEILQLQLEDKPAGNIDIQKIAKKIDGFSGADIQALVDVVVEDKLRASMKSGKIEQIQTKDLLQARKKVRPSTKDWFNTAKNYALYSNASGLYDDILKYLKM